VKAAVPLPLKGGKPPYEDWLRQCFYPRKGVKILLEFTAKLQFNFAKKNSFFFIMQGVRKNAFFCF